MLVFRRDIARQFLQVLRKAGLHRPVRMNLTPAVRLIAERESLTLQAMDFRLSVAWTVPQSNQPATLVVPLALLADCSQRTDGDVTLAVRQNRIFAQWTDRGVPIERDYDPIELDEMPPVPALPTIRSENSGKLLEALRDAMRSTDPDSTRYALGCVQLCGTEGRIDATDSDQALIQRGFQFPWAENVLVPASKVFESPVLPRDMAIQIGRTEHQVVVTVGAWTIALEIQSEGKFPDLQQIIPAAVAVKTRLRLDPADLEFLSQRLDQLPVDDELHHPVTIDLNGAVAIRARRSPDTPPTELVLRRSIREGDEVRLQTDRRFVKRALELGFTEFGFTSSEGAAVCRDAHREFVWMVLDAASAVPPSDNARQVDSCSEPAQSNRVARHLASAGSSRPPRATPRSGTVSPTPTSRKATMPKEQNSLSTDAALIGQLHELRAQLRSIDQAVATVARHLRARRKQQQLMKSTLASLKQLQTLNV